jgi:hypothetical protein
MPSVNDGGYYAIKGFLYQFDKTLIEILSNPDVIVEIEEKQDIAYQDFVIQVKHKETQEFQNHKIKDPVKQLIEEFKTDQTQKFCLYCYFNDRKPGKWTLQLTDLDAILGEDANNYTSLLKEKFTENFYVQFSEDFETQFLTTIELLRSTFSLAEEGLAFLYHSLLRSKLLDISIKKHNDRHVSRREIEAMIHEAERTVFYTAYSNYLGKDKYERLVKKEFFTIKTPNLENFERLFYMHCNNQFTTVDLSKIVISIANKYFKVGKSPQPYLCFAGLDKPGLIDLKQDLADQGILFDDGTYFDGDRFRLEKIIEKKLENEEIKIKIINHEYLERVLGKLKFPEVFQFYLESPIAISTERNHIKIQVTEPSQVLRMLN